MTGMSGPETRATRIAADAMPLANILGDDELDTYLLRNMAVEARDYLQSFSWCAAILDGWFTRGIGGIFGIFLFHILPASPDVDEWLWIMNGDLPSIYLSFGDAPSVEEAFREYVAGIRRWVAHVRSGAEAVPYDVPPIAVAETAERADDLEKRIHSLERILGPVFS